MQVQLQRKKRLRAEVQESCELVLRKREKAEKLVSLVSADVTKINFNDFSN